ncbi:hypothetical protein GEMRC1_013168 [Eukaryota sp. GEM-RC1]
MFRKVVLREAFEGLCQAKFDQCLAQVDQLLKRNNLTKSDIEQVLLVGGSTRIVKIRSMLRQKFGEKKVIGNLQVDEIVAKGASLLEMLKLPSLLSLLTLLEQTAL